MKTTPHIGDIVHFHPSKESRQAAIVTEIHPKEAEELRPRLNLTIFPPDGKTVPQQRQNVPPLELDPSEEFLALTGKQKNFWSFPNEHTIQTPPQKEQHQLKGSESNAINSENSIYGED